VGTTSDGANASRPLSLGVSLSQFRTELSFDGLDARLRQTQLALPFSWRFGDITLSATVAFIADGALIFDDGSPLTAPRGDVPAHAYRYDFKPGAAFGLGINWRLLKASADEVDLSLGLQLAYAHTILRSPDVVDAETAASASWDAFDLRVSLTVSRTFADVLTPWASVRLFGGPVVTSLKGRAGDSRTIVGADIRHVQLAAGMSIVPLPKAAPQWRIYAEGAILSERGFTLGSAVSF